jgi:hypothetical protein
MIKNMETITTEDNLGNIFRKNAHGKLHSENDIPAIEWSFGTKVWYKNGIKHREGGKPYFMGKNIIIYMENGKYHRIGGPAIIDHKHDSEQWYINGERHFEHDHFKKARKYKLDMLI